jgi:hypothetical protein
VDDARTLPGYQRRLDVLLDNGAGRLSAEEISSLRALVRLRRNGRRPQEADEASPDVHERANEIVALLEAAAPELRPRETQELDDLVAGEPLKPGSPPSFPVRMHRSGRSSR